MKLINGDCLDVMDNLIEHNTKVDLIICDLPYGTTSCAWDVIIPFEELWLRYERIIKPNRAILLFGSQPFSASLIASNPSIFKEELIWLKNKSGSGMHVEQRHMKIHENIMVFSFSSTYTYNPQKWLVEEKAFITQRKTFKDSEYVGNNIYAPTNRTRKPDTGERNPLSIISCRVPFTPQKSKVYSDAVDLRIHPTQKPLRLCEYLIETYSNPGDIVLDNCMGSGTTGVACKGLGRRFIGIEKDAGIYERACERIGHM